MSSNIQSNIKHMYVLIQTIFFLSWILSTKILNMERNGNIWFYIKYFMYATPPLFSVFIFYSCLSRWLTVL